MKVYQIDGFANNQWLMPIQYNGDLSDLMSFDCSLKSHQFQDSIWDVDSSLKPRGNFFTLGIGGAFAFDQEVFDNKRLRFLFELSGEIIPVKGINTKYYILNVLNHFNSLDPFKTEWYYYDDGEKDRIKKYVFDRKRMIESPVFKIPETYKIECLTTTGIKGPEDELKTVYEKSGLKGLEFIELFSS